MKIYKLDIDASQPTNQIVAMQQNSTGMLSVDVTNGGWPIRNLSCALYEGGDEISAALSGVSGAGYKLDVEGAAKTVKLVAKSTPMTCSRQYVASESGSNRTRQVKLDLVQIPAGVYKQDEFYNLASQFGSNTLPNFLLVSADSLSNANFDVAVVRAWIKDRPVWFQSSTETLDAGTLISAAGEIHLYTNVTVHKSSYTLSAQEYPAIGYYVDYQKDTVIRPSTNAACWGERDFVEPTPEPTPEPEPQTPAEEPNE